MKTSPMSAHSGYSAPKSTSSSPQAFPVWVRLGIPLVLALMAAWLNASTMQKQLQPIEALTLAKNVAAGEAVEESHFSKVRIGGDIDRKLLLTRQDLLTSRDGKKQYRSLAESLAAEPRFFARFIEQGAILTDGCFGSVPEVRLNEDRLYIPVSMIRGDLSRMTPNTFVYFRLIKSNATEDLSKLEELGPFRVALCDPQHSPSPDKRHLAVDYRLLKNGKAPPQAVTLHLACRKEREYIIELSERFREQEPVITPVSTAETPAKTELK